ncbi:augmin complex subunit dgt6 [Topomyia yanbarensis]|uniref:augmin complex subunit dgt6 n=1 Tax=Topomyia yanbarensis TaxID=2498891 RepID=UPI00273C69F7|nr:augmin complex subunit dgt6 [Topomyia yanbarensis]
MNSTVSLKRQNTLPGVPTVGAGEEQLDAAIFYCLNALTKRNLPSEQFRAIFAKGMFIKPNTKAFVHVIHFLFNIYDAKEFRKRFYWPIFDKTAENSFRSSTVEYINWLIEQGKLELEKIKAHTVVLPGGIKFMKFLLSLITFVLKDQLRRTRSGTGGKIVAKSDLARLIAHHHEWEDVGGSMREIMQKDLSLLNGRIQEVDDLIEELFENCHGPASQMSFEKLMQLWGTFNRTYFDDNEGKRQRLTEITNEYDKLIASAKRKLEPKEIALKIKEDDLKETLYRLEVLFPDNSCHFREVFDETGKIDAVKMFEIFSFLLPEIERHLTNFSVRSIESLKFELKELSKVAVKSDNICHELASMRRSLPFMDVKFQELENQEETDELNNDLGIRNKIFNTPPISLNFEDDTDVGGGLKPVSNRYRIALLDDDHVHQMNLRMRLLSSSVCHQLPKTPRSAKKKKPQQSPDGVFAVPKPARKERMNPLSMLNKITAQGKSKPKPSQPANSTMNLSSLSNLDEITLRPEFSSTLLGTPEKQSSHNRRSVNANETLVVQSQFAVPSVQQQQLALTTSQSPTCQAPPRFKTIYSEDIFQQTTTTKATMSPDSLFLLSQTTKTTTTRRRSSIVHFEQLQTSPSGKLQALVAGEESEGSTATFNDSISGAETKDYLCELPRIRISALDEVDSGICEENRLTDGLRHAGEANDDVFDKDDMEGTLNQEQDSISSDFSNTLVDLGFDKLSIACHHNRSTDLEKSLVSTPMETNEEDLFNVSDGILVDID